MAAEKKEGAATAPAKPAGKLPSNQKGRSTLEVLAAWVLRPLALCMSVTAAYNFRLFAVESYGPVIHEFDPWFNFRATQYLVDNGWEKFSTWYDYKSWYPLGRPVGTTVYPGMMITAAAIHRTLPELGYPMSLNDVCVYIPAVFGVLTTLFTYGLAHEVSQSRNVATFAAAFMSIIPAHMMRSVAGGYDNESVAVAAICLTLYLWVKALRSQWFPWFWGTLCGAAYIYLASSWGAYIFVLNMIGLHAGVLILSRRFSLRLYFAYCCFYLVGTAGAMQFPIIGRQPLQSMEQLGALAVFGMMQVLLLAELVARVMKVAAEDKYFLQIGALVIAAVAGLIGAQTMLPSGFLGPLSARVRGLFVRHTRTGNPLVDSVAEHRATPVRVYYQYFHVVMYLMPVGLGVGIYDVAQRFGPKVDSRTRANVDAKIFQICYFVVSYYFSSKMIRLVLLLAPPAVISAAICLERVAPWAWRTLRSAMAELNEEPERRRQREQRLEEEQKRDDEERRAQQERGEPPTMNMMVSEFRRDWDRSPMMRQIVAGMILGFGALRMFEYVGHCRMVSRHLSEPQIMVRIRDESSRDPQALKIADDFRESYWWLRDNTPENARILAWWDYGYQINGVANRTTLADGNTWNHEHIALLGRTLVLPEKESHETARHLADYVLLWTTKWAGMFGDDVAKMPHMARIAGSVYDDVDASKYDFTWVDRKPITSERMKESMLYQLHSYGFDPDVKEPELFEEVFTSENNMVRVYKIKDVDEESRAYSDAHHSYPPALNELLARKRDFKQILRL